MVKEVYFFTEMGYTAYPQDQARQHGYNNLMFPNEHFSPERAQELYSMYFDELQYCSETGFDGVMINEHHNNPLCMMPSVNVIGSILSRITQRGRIVFLGNVLPIHDNPLRVAEEIAMIDILSGGRVVCGFVRGIGQESIATNTNPVYNRERFDEAHNLIVKAWTTLAPSAGRAGTTTTGWSTPGSSPCKNPIHPSGFPVWRALSQCAGLRNIAIPTLLWLRRWISSRRFTISTTRWPRRRGIRPRPSSVGTLSG